MGDNNTTWPNSNFNAVMAHLVERKDNLRRVILTSLPAAGLAVQVMNRQELNNMLRRAGKINMSYWIELNWMAVARCDVMWCVCHSVQYDCCISCMNEVWTSVCLILPYISVSSDIVILIINNQYSDSCVMLLFYIVWTIIPIVVRIWRMFILTILSFQYLLQHQCLFRLIKSLL